MVTTIDFGRTLDEREEVLVARFARARYLVDQLLAPASRAGLGVDGHGIVRDLDEALQIMAEARTTRGQSLLSTSGIYDGVVA